MINAAALISTVIISYCIGSILSALVIGKTVKGIDVREHGSKSAGATNVFRVLGKPVGTAVGLADLAKGLAAGFIARFLVPELFPISGSVIPTVIQVAALYAVIFGHVFPIFAGFRGGKGVAAGAGALFALLPLVASVSLAVFILMIVFFGYVSLGSLAAALIMPITYMVSISLGYSGFDSVWFTALWITAALIALMHRKNIIRLVKGRENRFRTLWSLFQGKKQ